MAGFKYFKDLTKMLQIRRHSRFSSNLIILLLISIYIDPLGSIWGVTNRSNDTPKIFSQTVLWWGSGRQRVRRGPCRGRTSREMSHMIPLNQLSTRFTKCCFYEKLIVYLLFVYFLHIVWCDIFFR